MSGIGALFRPLPRMGPRLPFELPAPPRPHLPMPAPRALPRPAPGALPRPVPRPMPVPQTLPRTETGTLSRDRTREAERDCSKSQGRDKDCVECPPSRGEMAIANNGKGHSMSDLSARYQQWVTNFPFPHEWFWSGTWWDGFDEPRCTLLEAKANYAFLFVPLLGVPRPWARAKVKSDLLQKAEVHSDKARPTPPVFVEWHFLQRIVYEYCAAEYLRMGLANLKAFWNPMPGTDEHDDYQETRAKEQEEMKRFCEENPGYCA
ncbi:type VI secretion system effector protein TseT [Pseudomonas aeruginosa]|nr:restriction endonuclease fold toxin 5 domain-containing protein [Pseudomonas aeruginosa EF8E]HCL2715991.1 restriction endonuclease fold toxin 5 domain-containing protein [Pseudomonas aeruginosa EF8E]HCL2725455.1 restriction endonuclease fold toxin 5 domain-containing protein [Pseudomonas aeruginosa EF8E]HCL2729508.1 restriction endonuclease fold toxin 5 domain-containing protein [Pseudomonas aeruginosa EF8E]HCL2734511.1 restriction endonuclease fold toxin 5 domain-containing protein [Pseudom